MKSSAADDFLQGYIPSFDVGSNLKRLQRQYSQISSGEASFWATRLLPVHGTSVDRLESIVKDGRLSSIAELVKTHSEVVADRIHNATDALDISLGLDRYLFLSVGRVHPGDLRQVYICFPNEVIQRSGHLVALREIVHLGAIVSPEAAETYRRLLPGLNVAARNRQAADQFFESLIRGEDFTPLFASFLETHYETILDYMTATLFPNTEPLRGEVNGKETWLNAWEGPQLKIPNGISLEEAKCLLVVSLDPIIEDRVLACGFPRDKIFTLRESAIPHIRLLESRGIQPTQYGVIHGALYDLALIDDFENRSRMTAYRSRVL